MTSDTITMLRKSAEAFVTTLDEAAKAMEPKDDTPPVPAIPEKYGRDFAHVNPPSYDYPSYGEYYLSDTGRYCFIQHGKWHPAQGKRWILRKLDRPPMPAPANECWWSEIER